MKKGFQEGMINLLNVAERLCKKTENVPLGNVEVIDPHNTVSRVCVWGEAWCYGLKWNWEEREVGMAFLCEFSKGEQSFTVDRRVWGESRNFVLRGELLQCVLYGNKNAVYSFPPIFSWWDFAEVCPFYWSSERISSWFNSSVLPKTNAKFDYEGFSWWKQRISYKAENQSSSGLAVQQLISSEKTLKFLKTLSELVLQSKWIIKQHVFCCSQTRGNLTVFFLSSPYPGFVKVYDFSWKFIFLYQIHFLYVES